MGMGAHMLADIGVSPNDAQMEGARSFWDTREQFDPSRIPRGIERGVNRLVPRRLAEQCLPVSARR